MRSKHIESQEIEHPHISEVSSHSPNIESAILKLVIDSYLHGAQTCQLHDGKILGVSIHQGESDSIHLFVDDRHKMTIEVRNGVSRVSLLKQETQEDIDYLLPFSKCLGLPNQVLLNSLK
ncbi:MULTISPECIES: hypothetical protein [unclassified Lactococcus]|uniref:hypothetical protein n=1 Tax=unclassified Lactococcus TaxID=2643510 RepID=UPI0011C82419|nr:MULTISPECIES: hypothetical protein [unclassified Lactococcus]MQW22203.1 hypothetical protein [Lactococcus sp. dk101]TXK45135.1 hypothetical protein FVP42_02690 [Lactococcus sp. dk310]TXK51085.1 hypothetical protein FVP43_02400 [Lactococcus sp. dk322]